MIAAKALDRVRDAKLLKDPLAATMAFAASLEGSKHELQIAEVADMMQDRLLAIAEVHPAFQGASNAKGKKQLPLVAQLKEVKGTRQPHSLFEVARAFSRRVPLGRLAEIDPDVRPYLCAILVAAMWRAKEIL